jgi:hypothetical protein
MPAPCGELVLAAGAGAAAGGAESAALGLLAGGGVRSETPPLPPPGDSSSLGDIPPPPPAAAAAAASPKGGGSSKKRGQGSGGSLLACTLGGEMPVALLAAQLKADKELLRGYRADAGKVFFKSSRDKSKKSVPHITTNLHLHSMWVVAGRDKEAERPRGQSVPETRHDFVTFGAPAAHTLKFKHDGVVQLERKVLDMQVKIAHKSEKRSEKDREKESKGAASREQRKGSKDAKDAAMQQQQQQQQQQRSDTPPPPPPPMPPQDGGGRNPLLGGDSSRSVAAAAPGPPSEKPLASPGSSSGETKVSEKEQEQSEKLATLRFQLARRTEVSFCQALGGLVTGFAAKLTSAVLERDAKALHQLAEVGYLFQMESLVSTYGNETGMLGDMAGAFHRLNRVRFHLKIENSKVRAQEPLPPPPPPSTPSAGMGGGAAPAADLFPQRSDPSDPRNLLVTPSAVRRDGEHGGFVVELELRNTRELLKMEMDSNRASVLGGAIGVTAVVFSQGVNEFQTLAQSTGDTSFQSTVNAANLPLLLGYAERLGAHLTAAEGAAAAKWIARDAVGVKRAVAAAAAGCSKSKTEGCKMLQVVGATVRRLGGTRCTCCKSAKDRTSMSVTLEESRLLLSKHSLPPNAQKAVLSALRMSGVRLENSFKNVGHHNFAFNKIQKASLPAEYRPPDVVLGGLVT